MSDFHGMDPNDALNADTIRVGKGRPASFRHEIAAPVQSPLERLLSLESMELVQQRLRKFDTRDDAVLQARYGFEGWGKTLKETGQAVGGITGERVRQRESYALRDMRWKPAELTQIDGVPSISPIPGRLETIAVLARKIPLVIQGWMKNGIETTDQLEAGLKKAIPSTHGHVVNLGLSDLLSGKFFESDIPAGKTFHNDDQTFQKTAKPTLRYSRLFEAGCKLAGVPIAQAFDEPDLPLGSIAFRRTMAAHNASKSPRAGM